MSYHLKAFFLAGAAAFLVGAAATYTLYPPGAAPEGKTPARAERHDGVLQTGASIAAEYFNVVRVHHLFSAPPDHHPSAWTRPFSGTIYLAPEVATEDISRAEPVMVGLWSALATILLVFWFPGGMLLEELFKDDPLTHILAGLLGLWTGLFAAVFLFTAEVTFDNATSATARVYIDESAVSIPPRARLTVTLRTGPHAVRAVADKESPPSRLSYIQVEKGGETVFNLWSANRYRIQRAALEQHQSARLVLPR